MSYGKDGQSLMQCGNPPCVLKMVAKPYSKNIDTNSTYKQTCHHAQQGNPNNYLHIPRRRIGRPSYFGPNNSIYSPSSTTTSYITSMHHPESIYNIQRCSSIRRNFHHSPILVTTYPISSHPIPTDIPPVTSYIDLVNKMLCDSMEPRRYQYLSDSEMWYDSILKLKQDFTFNFDYLENMYKSEDKQPQDPNQI